MADSIGINRVPSNEEMQDYKQLGSTSLNMIFLKELARVNAEFTKNHEPFDAQCARLDFSDKIELAEKESQRRFGYVRQSDILNVKFDNLERYGDKSRFTIEADDEEIEIQNVNNTRTAVMVGHTVKYVCKERKHGCSVYIPLETYKERFEKKDKTKVVGA